MQARSPNSKKHGAEHIVRMRVQSHRQGAEPKIIEILVTADTPYLAAAWARRLPRFRSLKSSVVSVTTTLNVEATCALCDAIIFDGDITRMRNGKPRCYDCA